MKKVIFSILIIAISQNCFANVTCPTPSDFKKAKFSTARRIMSSPATTNNINKWVIISDDLNIEGKKWNLWYIFLTAATHPAQVIQEGTTKFNQKKINQVRPTIARDKINCHYKSDSATETLNAYHPPVTAMDWLFKPIHFPPSHDNTQHH